MRPATTQISLGIRQVWSESSLSAWRKLGSLATQWAQGKTLIGLGGCPSLGAQVTLKESLMVVRCNSSASRGLPEWRTFQFAPKNHYWFFFLHTLPSTITFRLECVLFYQFYVKMTTFFDKKKFGMAPLLYVDVETFGGNWHENDIKTSKSSYWRHARESSYTPHVKRHFLAPAGFTEISVGYARMLVLS